MTASITYTVRPRGAACWAGGLTSLRAAHLAAREARDAGLSPVVYSPEADAVIEQESGDLVESPVCSLALRGLPDGRGSWCAEDWEPQIGDDQVSEVADLSSVEAFRAQVRAWAAGVTS